MSIYEMNVANRAFYYGYKRLNRFDTGFRGLAIMESAIKSGSYYW